MIRQADQPLDEAAAVDLAVWLFKQQRALHQKIQRMPKGTIQDSEARMLAAVKGAKDIGIKYRRLKAKVLKGKKNGRAH